MEHVGCAVAMLQRAPQNLHSVKITFTGGKTPGRDKQRIATPTTPSRLRVNHPKAEGVPARKSHQRPGEPHAAGVIRIATQQQQIGYPVLECRYLMLTEQLREFCGDLIC